MSNFADRSGTRDIASGSNDVDVDAVVAAKLVERITGNAWATDVRGNFLYMTPSAIMFFGASFDTPNSSIDDNIFGWESLIHPDDYQAAVEAWVRSLQTGEHYNVEHRLLRRSGAYAWMRCSGQPVVDAGGVIKGWYGSLMDMAEPPPRQPLATDPQRQDAVPEMANVHPHDRSTVEQAAARAFFHGIPQISSYRQLQADGRYEWVEFRIEPDYHIKIDIDPAVARQDEPWTLAGSIGETRDAVQAALAIEKLYGGAWAIDAAGQFTYATPTAQTSIAMTLDDLNALLDGVPFLDGGRQGWQRGTHPEDSEKAGETLRHALRTGENWNFEYRVLRANGAFVWHRAAARPTFDEHGRVTGWYGTALDIDVYKKTEAALLERERELQQLIDTVPALIWSTTADGIPAYVNKPFTDVTGATLGDITSNDGSASLDVVHPEDRAVAREAFLHSVATGSPYIQRYRQRRVDGSYRWTETRAHPLRDDNAKIVQWYGVSTDVHDLIVAQEALRASERHLQQLVETLPGLIYCAAPDGEHIYRSRRLRDFIGSDLKEGDGGGTDTTFKSLIHSDDRLRFEEQQDQSLASGEPYLLRHRLRRSDGIYRWVEHRGSAMRNGDGDIVQWNGICLDIEDQIQAQEDLSRANLNLARASQAASLAELSASIAHEVNQPLSAVVNYSSACQSWLTAEPPNIERAQRSLDRILQSANTAADVVRRIRALFKQTTDGRESTDFAAVLKQAHDLVADEAARRRVKMSIEVESGLKLAAFDHIQIQQVLINLMRNALDAMASVQNSRRLDVGVFRSDGMVRVEIRDQGPGIEFPDKIFESFFTTKSQGMGMGLSISRSIIESHGGQLWAERNEPQGASFIFCLPLDQSDKIGP